MILQTNDLKRAGAWRGVSQKLRRITITIAGFSVLTLGLVLLVVPVPGTSIVVFPLGLTILAKEFAWARLTLVWARRRLRALWIAVRRIVGRSPSPAPAR